MVQTRLKNVYGMLKLCRRATAVKPHWPDPPRLGARYTNASHRGGQGARGPRVSGRPLDGKSAGRMILPPVDGMKVLVDPNRLPASLTGRVSQPLGRRLGPFVAYDWLNYVGAG